MQDYYATEKLKISCLLELAVIDGIFHYWKLGLLLTVLFIHCPQGFDPVSTHSHCFSCEPS